MWVIRKEEMPKVNLFTGNDVKKKSFLNVEISRMRKITKLTLLKTKKMYTSTTIFDKKGKLLLCLNELLCLALILNGAGHISPQINIKNRRQSLF